MTKRAKRIGWGIGAVVGVVMVLWVIWLPILSSLVVRSGAKFFWDNFQPSKDLHDSIHVDTWATWYFAGTKGLPTIEMLSRDPSLIPSGRETASNLFVHISTGGHLPCVRWELAQGHLPWIGRQYYYYLLKNDTTYLKRKGVSIQEGI